ncbi:MAG TPA: hypothetical protein VLH56_16860 [Dissulfurispiraceae bacterium]|nr:hypothetical protein [Dissulfurispiraceae bacterium]
MMQMISGGASKSDLVRAFGHLTLELALEEGYPSLARLAATHGADKTEKALAVVLLEASAAFESSIEKEAALELAIEIKARYFYMSLEECYVCMQELKSQKIFGRLTPNKALAAMSDYAERRIQLAAQQSLNRHLALKEPRDAARSGDATDQAFRDFEKQYKISKIRQPKTKKT